MVASDFETFYQTKVHPYLDELRSQRSTADKWGIAIVICSLLAIASFFIEQVFAGFLFICLVVVSVYNYARKKDRFIDNYKENIINEIIDFIYPGFVYKPNNYISSKEYKASGHYRYIYDIYEGDDYIEGRYKNVNFHCSELYAGLAKRGRAYMSSSRYVEGPVIFKGLFFVAVINKFRGGTYIWSQGEEQLPVSMADEHYRLFPLPHVYKIKSANEEFEKYFSVYSSYPSEAQIILDEEMLQHMVNFRKQIKRRVQFSIVAGKFYVSIPVEEDLLEPAADLDDKEQIKEYFFSILLILSIINQLRLTRFA